MADERSREGIQLAPGRASRLQNNGKGLIIQRASQHYRICAMMLHGMAETAQPAIPTEWRLRGVENGTEKKLTSIIQRRMLEGVLGVFRPPYE